MASDPQSTESDSNRNALPFEPKRRKASTPKNPKKPPSRPTAKATPAKRGRRSSIGIPDAVNKRMIRRMAAFCGIPTALGVSTFFGSYLAVINGVDLPNAVVLLTSLGFFGIGVLGLSYGALSTSWDEDKVGGLLGIDEFQVNFKRMAAAWRPENQGSDGSDP